MFTFFYNKLNIGILFSKKKLLESLSNKQSKEKFNIITSYAMFYDIDDPNSFCKDIYDLLNNRKVERIKTDV